MSELYELTGKETKQETREKIPCGEVVKTRYFLDGKLVREDVNVIVSEEFLLGSKAGEIK